MDIEKLESLACLRLKPEEKEDMEKSLIGIMNSLEEVIDVNVEKTSEVFQNNTSFRNQEFNKPNTSGLNITEDGFFLAPKVIRKE